MILSEAEFMISYQSRDNNGSRNVFKKLEMKKHFAVRLKDFYYFYCKADLTFQAVKYLKLIFFKKKQFILLKKYFFKAFKLDVFTMRR